VWNNDGAQAEQQREAADGSEDRLLYACNRSDSGESVCLASVTECVTVIFDV